MTELPTPPEAELARLADGSLPAERETELRAQVAQSPRLAAAFAEQERAVALLRSVDAPAPDTLRARIAVLTDGASPAAGRTARGRLRLRRALVLPGATALAVVVAAVVILIGSTSATPTMPQAAHLALSAATLPAPAVQPGNPRLLRIRAAGIPFSNWHGWRAVGTRSDVIGGRRITTVFYQAPDGTRVGYAIASGSPLQGSPRVSGYQVSYTLGEEGSARLVTWVRDGHTCVIAGRSVTYQTLLRLARDSAGSTSS
ncbi:MAG TPA: hypothetical protein VG365_09865 [Solirubrobacteraceae bacterium]|jgi:anti-sigma factor RsiW|nr:hypothetical protein [Solirubrobacteraceae bacterium]